MLQPRTFEELDQQIGEYERSWHQVLSSERDSRDGWKTLDINFSGQFRFRMTDFSTNRRVVDVTISDRKAAINAYIQEAV